ncbi:olfactory receptor 10A7-like [Microcaecilia unicolor]|uniref:Olfactory receptor n=1 Tax=Microcaecilia unicolor TaxID=1415580 RepID=A0A6P7WN40_9AMPH|nr:olfactory receptor 10A7-like [Microcaecilia unicolor]
MTRVNQSHITEFILLGFSTTPELQPLLFAFFLIIYLATLMGNAVIIVTVTMDALLHTPMYFFLRNLSLLEICYTSITLPKMLSNFLIQDRSISFVGCATQLYFFCSLGTSECFFLAVMAYDRYIAICDPLRYPLIISRRRCTLLAAGSWAAGLLLSLGQISFVFSLPYCGPNIIDHFFCDILPVLKLACADILMNEVAILLYSFLVIPVPFILILISYARIITSILKIHSVEGRWKAFSTCSSHLTSVSLFYGTATITYLRTKSNHSQESDKALALLYSVLTPMLNPIIYTLRNKEFKRSLKKLMERKKGS